MLSRRAPGADAGTRELSVRPPLFFVLRMGVRYQVANPDGENDDNRDSDPDTRYGSNSHNIHDIFPKPYIYLTYWPPPSSWTYIASFLMSVSVS